VIVAYLPEPHKHPLWNDIQRLIQLGTDPGVPIIEDNELVWIAFEERTLFAAGTIALKSDGAWLLAVGGYEHKRWLRQALDVAASWARDCGAGKLLMRGRRGWARALVRAGWDASREGDNWLYSKDL
jgi:hypothetical protein